MNDSIEENIKAVQRFTDATGKLIKAVIARGGKERALYELILSDDELCARLVDMIMEAMPEEVETEEESEVEVVEPFYRIKVDWSRSLIQMIDAGWYDFADEFITEKNFPLSPPDNISERSKHPRRGAYRTPGEFTDDGAVDVELVRLNRSVDTKEVLAEIDRRSLRPATLPELLAFGEKYPDVQRQFPVVALGSSLVGPCGYRQVPFLCGDSGCRHLDLTWGASVAEYNDYFRFLAVRK